MLKFYNPKIDNNELKKVVDKGKAGEFIQAKKFVKDEKKNTRELKQDLYKSNIFNAPPTVTLDNN